MVILTKNLAIKIPYPLNWRRFLWGLLANMQERDFSRLKWAALCPVVFSLPGGFLVVMKRATPLTQEPDYQSLSNTPEGVIPAEHKIDSWGCLDGNIVAIDYG